jgi:hypothetical protein
MSYTRPPASTLAGTALKQTPPPSTKALVPVILDAEIASTSNLGVIQVGSGLSVTPQGLLSTTGSTGLINVTLTSTNYTALATDVYIGGTASGITITLPLGVIGKTYTVKNQVAGNITVTGTGGQKIDTANTKSLGTNDSLVVVFDGTRWNIITS